MLAPDACLAPQQRPAPCVGPPPAPKPPVFGDRFFSVAAAGDALHSASAVLVPPPDHEPRERDQKKLAEKLQVRLRFAAFKIRRGWQDCTVEEVKRQCQTKSCGRRTPLRVPAVAPFLESAYRSAENLDGRAPGAGVLPLPAWRRAEQLGADRIPQLRVGRLGEDQARPPPPNVSVPHSEELGPTSAPAANGFAATSDPYPALKYYGQTTASSSCSVVAAAEAQDANLAGCGPVAIWEDNLTHSPADDLSSSTINPFYNARELMVISPVPTPARASQTSSSCNSPVQLVFPEQGGVPCDGSGAAVAAAAASSSSSRYPDATYALPGEFLCALGAPGPFRSEAGYVAVPATAAFVSPPPGTTATMPEAAAALMARLGQPQDHNWSAASPRHCNLYSDVPVIPLVHNWSTPTSRPA